MFEGFKEGAHLLRTLLFVLLHLVLVMFGPVTSKSMPRFSAFPPVPCLVTPTTQLFSNKVLMRHAR
jgi:hypothetical protein